MEHLVRFTTAEGRDGYHQAANLDEALKFVERLRNNEAADNVRLFRLQEIPIEFRAYYRVEVRPDSSEQPVESAAVPPVEETVASESLVPAAETAHNGTDGDASSRRLFGRS